MAVVLIDGALAIHWMNCYICDLCGDMSELIIIISYLIGHRGDLNEI